MRVLRRRCACGQRAGYAGRRRKTFTTVASGGHPRTSLLSLRRLSFRQVSARPCVGPAQHVRHVARQFEWSRPTAVRSGVSFAEAEPTWITSTGGRGSFDPKQVERTVVSARMKGRGRRTRRRSSPPPALARALYLEKDGTVVPVHSSPRRKGYEASGPTCWAKTRDGQARSSAWTVGHTYRRFTRCRTAIRGRSVSAPPSRATASRPTDPAAGTIRATQSYRRRHPAPRLRQQRRVSSSSATTPPGSGTWPASCSPAPSTWSTATTPRAICATWPKPSTSPAPTSLHRWGKARLADVARGGSMRS